MNFYYNYYIITSILQPNERNLYNNCNDGDSTVDVRYFSY